MICTLDIGNSHIYTIIYNRDKEIQFEKRTPTKRENDKQFYLDFFSDIKEKTNDSIEIVIIACVVPSILDTVMASADELFHCPVHSINASNVDLVIHLDDPNELGADFIAGAYAAINKYDMPVIIIDMGTASKKSVVTHNHHFLGGIIQPGVAQQAKILNQNIPHLPKIELKVPDRVIGHNTIECIQSGITHGALLGLIGMAKQVEKELGEPAKIILTGGYINLYNHLYGYEFNPYLINEGLYYLALERMYHENK